MKFLLFLLLSALPLLSAFTYKSADKWYDAADNRGLIDLSGIEYIKFYAGEIQNSSKLLRCKDGMRTPIMWFMEALNCEKLQESNKLITCKAVHTKTHELSLDCTLGSSLEVVLDYVNMGCEAYKFPTNYIRRSNSCVISGTLNPGLYDSTEFVGHIFVSINIVAIIIIKLVRLNVRVSCKEIALFTLQISLTALWVCSYIYFFIVSCMTGSTITSSITAVIWALCIIKLASYPYYKRNAFIIKSIFYTGYIPLLLLGYVLNTKALFLPLTHIWILTCIFYSVMKAIKSERKKSIN